MSLTHSMVESLTVLDRDGNAKAIIDHPIPGTTTITGKVALEGALGIALTPGPGAITLSVDFTAGADDPCFLEKYQAVLTGGIHVGCYGEGPCDFNSRYPGDPDWRVGAPYWVSYINNTPPNALGVFELLGSACGQLGLFNAVSGDGLLPSATPNALELFNLCEACTDCYDYAKIYALLAQLSVWTGLNKDVNLIEPVADYPLDSVRMYKQYQALLHYWNYLVHSQSLLFRASADGPNMVVTLGYVASDCGPYDGVDIYLEIAHVGGQDAGCVYMWPQVVGQQVSTPSLIPYIETKNSNTYSSSSASSSSGGGLEGGVVPTMSAYVSLAAPIYNNQEVVVYFYVWVRPSDPCAAEDNTYQLTASWRNTALGSEITRTKTLIAPSPTS